MSAGELPLPPTRAQVARGPELIAPAGDRDCAQAAVENGADAVYFGLAAGFNARARAANFTPEQLPELMAYVHRRGVKGYVTLNTLVFPGELEELEATVRTVVAAGVDAVLVQDVGAARLIRAVCPDVPLHASTQMTLTSAECMRVAESLGIERVVLPRELSLAEIAAIRRQTTLQLEAFVHGALCVAYSGQCLASEALGGRSANRGQCAQACRMPYQLICDGQKVDLGQRKYLLSPQDLAAYDLLPQLIEAGVSALKIEGRLKPAEYVANITRHYRTAIDAAAAGEPAELTPQEIEEMEVSFSRGFSHGWLEGCNHKALVPGLSSAKRGVLLGEVRALGRERIHVQLASAVKRGDGVVFEGDRITDAEQGGRVYEVFQDGRSVKGAVSPGIAELAFARGAIDPRRLWIGQRIWKTDDPALTRRLRKTYSGDVPRRQVPLDLTVEAAVGSPLRITGRAASGAHCRLESPDPLPEAVKHPLTAELLREHLGRLGGTSYQLRHVDATIDGRPMVPLSVLGKLRHQMVEQLDASITDAKPRPVASDPVLEAVRKRGLAPGGCVLGLHLAQEAGCLSPFPDSLPARLRAGESFQDSPRPLAQQGQGQGLRAAQLHVLCRSAEQLESVLAAGMTSVIADFQDIRQYAGAVQIARAAHAEILLATPRIQKPGEIGLFRALERHKPNGILARNLAGLAFFVQRGVPAVADFSLNAANDLTVAWLRQQGASRVTASYDVNRDQLLDLVAAVPPECLEVVVHQHMPLFHMEHCVFCATLSPGVNRTDCGRPCERRRVCLRDRIGMEHPLRAEVGCRNTLFNAVPQSAAEIVPLLVSRGVRHFRIELLDEDDAAPPGRLIGLYRDLLAGQTTGRDVWRRLKAANRVGVTRGTLEDRRNPEAFL